jgi:hypothetical protein
MEERPKLSEDSAEEDADEVQSDRKGREGFFKGWAELISGRDEDQEQPTRSEKFREWFRGVLFPSVVTQESPVQHPDNEQLSIREEEYDVPSTTDNAYERLTTIADRQDEQEANNPSAELTPDDESTTESPSEGEEAIFEEEDAKGYASERIKQSEIPVKRVESIRANEDVGGQPEKPEQPSRPAPEVHRPVSADAFPRKETTISQPVEKKIEAAPTKESKSTLAVLPALLAAEFLGRRKQKKAEKKEAAQSRRRTEAVEEAGGQPDTPEPTPLEPSSMPEHSPQAVETAPPAQASEEKGQIDKEPLGEPDVLTGDESPAGSSAETERQAFEHRAEAELPEPEEARQSERHEIKDGPESKEKTGKKSKKDPLSTGAYHISEVIGDKSKDIPPHRGSRSAKSSPRRLRAAAPQHTQAMSAGFITAVAILAISMVIYLSA